MPAPVTTKMTGSGKTFILTNGSARSVVGAGLPIPATVWASPVAGDTITVEYSLDDGSTWVAWPSGPVTVFTQNVLLSGVTSIRFTRSAGAGTTSTCGVC